MTINEVTTAEILIAQNKREKGTIEGNTNGFIALWVLDLGDKLK